METLTLTELAARMAQRWRVLVVGALLGLMSGVVAHVALPTRYEATAVVFVDAAETDRIDMTAEAAVASSRRVTAEALDAIGDPRLTIADLEDAEYASPVEESRLLRIAYDTDDPAAEARGADAVAQAYLAVRTLAPTTAPDAGFTGTVVDPARPPRSPSGPGLPATALGTTMLGLLAAAPLSATRTRAARAS